MGQALQLSPEKNPGQAVAAAACSAKPLTESFPQPAQRRGTRETTAHRSSWEIGAHITAVGSTELGSPAPATLQTEPHQTKEELLFPV